MSLALSEVQLVSRLQTHFMRLAQLSAAAEVEFAGYAARLQGCIMEAQTAVEYAVSRALLGDKASAFVADDKVAQAEAEFARCEGQARERRGVDEVRRDCHEKLAEVRAQVKLLRCDSEAPTVGATATGTVAEGGASAAAVSPAAVGATQLSSSRSGGSSGGTSSSSHTFDRWRAQQASVPSPPRHTFGVGQVHTIGAGVLPSSSSLPLSGAVAARPPSASVATPDTTGGAEFTFGAAKVRSNLEEVVAVADHVEALLVRESGAAAGGGRGGVGDEALLAEAVDSLDVCFDLLWEARALVDARAAFRRHRDWQLRLQRLLRAVRAELGDLEQEAAQARHNAAAFVQAVAAAPGRSPSELHRQADLRRLTDGGLVQLDGMLAEAAAAVEELTEFVGSGGGGGGDGHADNGGGGVGREAAEHELEALLQGCRSEFAAVRQRLANPLYSASPSASPRHRTRSSAAAMSLQSREADAASEQAEEEDPLQRRRRAAVSFDDSATTSMCMLHHSDEDDDGGDACAGGDDGDREFFPSAIPGGGSGDHTHGGEYNYDEPAMLSASQLARRARVRREVLSVLRARRRRHQLQHDEAEDRDRQAAVKRQERQQRQQRRQQRERAKARAATRHHHHQHHHHHHHHQQQQQQPPERSSPPQQRDEHRRPRAPGSPAPPNPDFFRSRAGITQLPGLAAPAALDALGPLFFPGTEATAAASAVLAVAGDAVAAAAAAAARRRNNEVVRVVMRTPELAGREAFLLLAAELAAAASPALPLPSEQTVARVWRVVDVRGQGIVPPFELLLGLLVVLFAAKPHKYAHAVFEMMDRARGPGDAGAARSDIELFVALAVRARVMLLPRAQRHPHVSLGEVQDAVLRRFFDGSGSGRGEFISPRRFSSFASQLDYIDKLCLKEF